VPSDWTQALSTLSRYVSIEQRRLATEYNDQADAVQVPVHVDGPYGGCGLD
jgi:hypothetical protein